MDINEIIYAIRHKTKRLSSNLLAIAIVIIMVVALTRDNSRLLRTGLALIIPYGLLFLSERTYSSIKRKSNDSHDVLSIANLILKRRAEANIVIVLITVFVVMLLSLSFFIWHFYISDAAVWFVSVFYALLLLHFAFFRKRILGGAYGNTEEDAREIISFVIENFNETKDDKGMRRPIITNEEINKIIVNSNDFIKPSLI